jgi:hypothetical protein
MATPYPMAPWQACPYTSSVVIALEMNLKSRIVVIGLHRDSHAPIFRVLDEIIEPTKRQGSHLRIWWGVWPLVDGRNVAAWRYVHVDEKLPRIQNQNDNIGVLLARQDQRS